MECLYTILEVDKDASHEEIRRSYKALALKYHPDKCPEDDQAETKFVKVKEAYDILGDPIRRNIYDQNSSSINFDNIIQWKEYVNSIIKTIYTVMKKNIFPKDICINLSVSINEIYNRRIKKLIVKVKRWQDGEFVTSNENIYVDLLNFKPEYLFSEKGDASVLKGLSNSNIIVKVTIQEDNVYISDLLSPYDLCITKNMCLNEFYVSEMIELSYLPDIKVKNEQKESYVMSGVGLPYMTDDGEIKRGDIYLKIHISVPQNVPKEFIDYIKTI